MKKGLLLSMVAALAVTSASAESFEYAKSYPTKYLVGLTGVFQTNNAETQSGLIGDANFGFGIEANTYQTYDINKRFFVGLKGGLNYMFGTGYLDSDSWGFYVEPRAAYKVTQRINLYVGVGYQYDSYSEYSFNDEYTWIPVESKTLEYSMYGGYFSFGMDYIMSDNLILGLKYSRGFALDLDNEQNIGNLYKTNDVVDQNKLRFELTIPFT